MSTRLAVITRIFEMVGSGRTMIALMAGYRRCWMICEVMNPLIRTTARIRPSIVCACM